MYRRISGNNGKGWKMHERCRRVSPQHIRSHVGDQMHNNEGFLGRDEGRYYKIMLLLTGYRVNVCCMPCARAEKRRYAVMNKACLSMAAPRRPNRCILVTVPSEENSQY